MEAESELDLVAKGTLLSTSKGLVHIEDLSDNRILNRAVPLKEAIYTIDGGGIKRKILKHYYGGEEDTIVTALQNGLVLETSKNYRVMTSEGWKTVSKLKWMDQICMRREGMRSDAAGGESIEIPFQIIWHKTILPSKFSNKLCMWLGMVCSKARINSRKKCHTLMYTAENDLVGNLFDDLSEELFGVRPYHTSNGPGRVIKEICRVDVCSFTKMFLLADTLDKYDVPSAILTGSDSEQRSFLAGITAGTPSSEDGLGLVVYQGRSQKISAKVALMLRNFGGVVHEIEDRAKRTKLPRYTCILRGGLAIQTPEPEKRQYIKLHGLNTRLPSELLTLKPDFHDYLRPVLYELRQKRPKVCATSILDHFDFDYDPNDYYIPVKSTKIRRKELFGISVEGSHQSYLINGVVMHSTVTLPKAVAVKLSQEKAKEIKGGPTHEGACSSGIDEL